MINSPNYFYLELLVLYLGLIYLLCSYLMLLCLFVGMGTKVQSKSYLPGYHYSMRDMNEDSNNSSWPLFYTNKPLPNGQYYNSFLPRTVAEAYDKDALKQKMLEHEAIFKYQVLAGPTGVCLRVFFFFFFPFFILDD